MCVLTWQDDLDGFMSGLASELTEDAMTLTLAGQHVLEQDARGWLFSPHVAAFFELFSAHFSGPRWLTVFYCVLSRAPE